MSGTVALVLWLAGSGMIVYRFLAWSVDVDRARRGWTKLR